MEPKMKPTIRGRVWCFGDNVDTDVMAPWNSMGLEWEERRKTILHNRPGFIDEVQPGDIIVAGRNWGCGSSREQAPENLKRIGIGAIVAESFGRIYFRNCIAIAFPNVVCPGVSDAFEEGDELELDLKSARVRNVSKETGLQGQAYAPEMLEILEKGGLMEVLKAKLAASEES